jgi:hypothetical protein
MARLQDVFKKSDQPQLRQNLALCCNNRAWELAAFQAEAEAALAGRGVELPDDVFAMPREGRTRAGS